MSTHSYSVHLTGTEKVRVNHMGINHDALYVERGGTSTAIVLGHNLAPTDRVRILRELSEAASDLADEINLRDLEASA